MPGVEPLGHQDLRALAVSLRTAAFPGWLRAVLDPGAVSEALAGRVGEVVPGADELVGLRLLDARAGRSWSLRFQADVATAEGPRTVMIAAHRPPAGSEPRADEVWLPGLGLGVRTVDSDADLPAVRLLGDPRLARELLEPVLGAAGWTDLRLREVTPRLVRLKPGRRATVLHELRYADDADPSWPRRVVTKTYRDADGEDTNRWMRELWVRRPGGRQPLRIARPLGYLSGHRTLVQTALPGDRTLADLLLAEPAAPDGPAGTAVLPDVVAATAEALVALHGCGATTGPARSGGDDVRAATRVLDRLEGSLPVTHLGTARALVAAAGALVQDEPAVRVPVHGAFRPAQVLLDDRRVGLVDFDGFGQGDAAADVGRFVARVAELSSGDDARPGAMSHGPAQLFVDAYRAAAPLSTDRAERYVVLDLAVGAVRSWYRGRPDRAALLLRLLVDELDHLT